jgi:hypothetical protein
MASLLGLGVVGSVAVQLQLRLLRVGAEVDPELDGRCRSDVRATLGHVDVEA